MRSVRNYSASSSGDFVDIDLLTCILVGWLFDFRKLYMPFRTHFLEYKKNITPAMIPLNNSNL